MTASKDTRLLIDGPRDSREIPLESPRHLVLGRDEKCDLVLPDDLVSRKHATLYCDPFGRWIIEDLDSRNGIRVRGQRVPRHVILPGDRIEIKPFTLHILRDHTRESCHDADLHTTTILSDDPISDVVSGWQERGVSLSQARLKRLNAIFDQLSGLSEPSQVYEEVCRMLADGPGAVAAVLVLPASAGEPSKVLSVHADAIAANGGESGTHISRSILQAVAFRQLPVMARSGVSLSDSIQLTINDGTQHVVMCAPLGDLSETHEVLYLDLPSHLAADDAFDFMQAVARQLGLTTKGLLLAEARAQSQVLNRELAMAQEIQGRLVPRDVPAVPGLDLSFMYQPAMWVGGDYCDLWIMPDGRLALAVGDVSGKGLPGAMVMSNLHAALRNTLTFCPDASAAMTRVDAFLRSHLPEGMFVTLFLGLLSPQGGRLEYVNAGHPLPLILGTDGSVRQLGLPANPPLGLAVKPFEMCTEQIEAGLLVVTDGITEARSPQDELYGIERLQRLLAGSAGRPAAQIIQALEESVTSFRDGCPQHDDMTALALVRRSIAPRP